MEIQGVGLGTFPFSHVFSSVSDRTAEKITNVFLEKGGKYIQTAPYYVGVDPLMKKILNRIPRSNYILGTLCVKNRQNAKSGKYNQIIAQCDDSLFQLGVDYIDVYLTSTPKATDAPFSETIGAMSDLKKQGKVREIGVCNVTLTQLKEYNFNGAVRYVQNRFSLIDQSSSTEFLEYCYHNNIKLIPYNVIEWGLLTNKILKHFRLKESDVRQQVLPVFKKETLSLLRQWVIDYLKPIADQNHTTIEGLSIYWALNQPSVCVCLVGATKKEQILSSLEAMNLAGRDNLVKELDEAYIALKNEVHSLYGQEINDFLRNSYGKW